MALYRYFKASQDTKLPDPQGPLLKEVPSTAIAAANNEVKHVVELQRGKMRGTYTKFTTEQKAEIGKRAAEHGVAATVRYYKKRFPGIKENSVRTWKNVYTSEIGKRRREGSKDFTVQKLLEKKRGRPFLLGEELEMQVRTYLAAIAIGCAEGIVKNKDSRLLASNGGYIVLSKHWGTHLLARMGFVKRRASTKAKIEIKNFEEVKAQFLLDIKVKWRKFPLT